MSLRKVYLAGRVTAQLRLRQQREVLQHKGFQVLSTWLDVAVQYPEALTQQGEALRDLDEIRAADLFLIDTLDESPTGGREFEAGYAHALNIPIWRVGPARHIFHALAEKTYISWKEFDGIHG